METTTSKIHGTNLATIYIYIYSYCQRNLHLYFIFAGLCRELYVAIFKASTAHVPFNSSTKKPKLLGNYHPPQPGNRSTVDFIHRRMLL